MENNSWLDGLKNLRFSYLRNGGDFESREILEIKTCGICKKEFMPRENNSRLVCYSKYCMQQYDIARLKIKSEKLQEEKLRERLLVIEKKKKEEEIIRKRKSSDGYVYLMMSSNGYYKIGISNNVKKRLQGIKRQFPVMVEIIHYFACYDCRKTEKYLHKKYFSKRVEYEWFQLDKYDVEWIKSIKDNQLDEIT